MAAGVASGLQNRFGVRKASRVGSIPTRSRHAAGLAVAAGLRTALLLCLVSVPARGLDAQEPVALDSASTDTVAVSAGEEGAADTVSISSSVQAAGADSSGVSPPVSPMGAFFRSLVLPGWGQVSVDQPGRGAFYFAMEAGSLWMLLKTNAKLNAARRATPLDDDLVGLREDQFEDGATLAVFWALFAGVDAWVSAQLWDWTGEVVPPPDGSAGAAFRYSIPVGP
jgi:hypothetical protein